MTPSDEKVAEWRGEASHEGALSPVLPNTNEYRIIVLANALTEARRERDEWQARHEREHLRRTTTGAKLARVQGALARHPKVCDRHTEGDPISCGWKRAVADVTAVLDGEGGSRGE